ncbi:MAG: cytochrome c family protein [Desulfatitalea sp.]|nr:cytochrome c family protein [Desulfatitalea sp.]NNK02299.1 cytochrome c family protein [Desulfatitalea sp.]
MLKRTVIALTTLLLIISFSGIVLALEKGNARKGKYTYRKIYKACMARGEVNSAKPPISPDQKTQAQWTRLFNKKDFSDFGCRTEWDSLDESDMMDIYAYLYDHAADSPSPAKCK